MNVSTEVLGTARIVSWDNQRHRNAWGGATIAAIADAVQAAATDPDVRCIVVRGAGEDFSAGDDLFEAADADPGLLRRHHRRVPATDPGRARVAPCR